MIKIATIAKKLKSLRFKLSKPFPQNYYFMTQSGTIYNVNGGPTPSGMYSVSCNRSNWDWSHSEIAKYPEISHKKLMGYPYITRLSNDRFTELMERSLKEDLYISDAAWERLRCDLPRAYKRYILESLNNN